MHIDLTDMLRVQRIARPWPHRSYLWQLLRWEPSELRRSGIYKPLTRPVERRALLKRLHELGVDARALEAIAGP